MTKTLGAQDTSVKPNHEEIDRQVTNAILQGDMVLPTMDFAGKVIAKTALSSRSSEWDVIYKKK